MRCSICGGNDGGRPARAAPARSTFTRVSTTQVSTVDFDFLISPLEPAGQHHERVFQSSNTSITGWRRGVCSLTHAPIAIHELSSPCRGQFFSSGTFFWSDGSEIRWGARRPMVSCRFSSSERRTQIRRSFDASVNGRSRPDSHAETQYGTEPGTRLSHRNFHRSRCWHSGSRRRSRNPNAGSGRDRTGRT